MKLWKWFSEGKSEQARSREDRTWKIKSWRGLIYQVLLQNEILSQRCWTLSPEVSPQITWRTKKKPESSFHLLHLRLLQRLALYIDYNSMTRLDCADNVAGVCVGPEAGVTVEPGDPAALPPGPGRPGWIPGRPAPLCVWGVSQLRQMRCDCQIAPGTIKGAGLGWGWAEGGPSLDINYSHCQISPSSKGCEGHVGGADSGQVQPALMLCGPWSCLAGVVTTSTLWQRQSVFCPVETQLPAGLTDQIKAVGFLSLTANPSINLNSSPQSGCVVVTSSPMFHLFYS